MSALRGLTQSRAELEQTIPTVMVMQDRPDGRMTYVLDRGLYSTPDKDRPVQPGVLEFLLPAAKDAPAKGAEVAKPGLDRAPQWQRLMRVWTEAEEVSSGKRGAYPFDEAGKKKLLVELAACGKEVDALTTKKLLTTPEAGLLKKELDRLTKGVQRKRPTSMKRATCYKPAPPLSWPYYGLQRLEGRLALLEKLAGERAIHPAAVRKALAGVVADIQSIEKSGYITKQPKGEKKAKGDPEKRAKCITKARKPYEGEGIRFIKDDDGTWWWLTMALQRGKMFLKHRIEFEVKEQTDTTITLKLKGRDRGRKPMGGVPRTLTVEVPNDYEIYIDDKRLGKKVYKARVATGSDEDGE